MRNRLLLAAAIALTGTAALAQNNSGHHDHASHQDHGAHHAQPKQSEKLSPQTQRQIAEVRAAIARYGDFEVAKREGWTKFGGEEPLMGEHWSPPAKLRWPDYQGPGAKLDFARPNNLMYATIEGKRVLTGAAFIVRLGPGEALPTGFAGSADRWHVHDMEQAIAAATEERPMLRWLANWWLDSNYRDKGDNRGRLAMVHVWAALPNPDGAFADHNRLVPYLKHGLPSSAANGASVAAARGLDLAAPKGCENAAAGKLWIADASRAQKRAVERACELAAKQVSAALLEHRAHPAMLNRAAESAWESFETVWAAQLTLEQRARIAAITEHGGH